MTIIHGPHTHPADVGADLDATLPARLRAGDPAAFDELFRHHHRQVARYLAARLGAAHQAAVDDLVQDTFTAALAHPARFITADPLRCLLRLAARCRRQHLRTTAHGGHPTPLTDDRTPPPDVAAPASPALTHPGLARALARLTPDQRLAVQLLYLYHQPTPVVAARMGRSIPAVRGLRRRALRHLHQSLTGQPRPTPPTAPALATPAARP
jgi:DNA-directed RNA polymerase specialized sigma24 family protein